MNVTTERLPQSQVVFQIEIDQDRVDSAVDDAYRRLGQRARIPGFRPGKAPMGMLRRYITRARALEDALQRLLPESFQEALKESDVEPFGRPSYEVESVEPLVYKATVPVRPTVHLGEYRAIRFERQPVAVADEDVDRAVDDLRHRYATIQPVEREAREGDIVRGNISALVEGQPFFDREDVQVRVSADSLRGLPGLHDLLVGLKAGDQVERDVDVPEDFSDEVVAGKRVHYQVRVHDVRQEDLPNLDDEFAQMLGDDFPTLLALREHVRKDLQADAERREQRRLEDKAVDALVERATFEYPPQLVAAEVDRLLEERFDVGRGRRGMEDYLRNIGRSEEDLRTELRPLADERVRRSLALTQLAEEDAVTVGDADVDQAIEELVSSSPGNAERNQAFWSSDMARDTVRNRLLTRRTLDRLIEIVTAPTEVGAEVAAPATAPPRPRTRRRKAETAATAEAAAPEETASAAAEH